MSISQKISLSFILFAIFSLVSAEICSQDVVESSLNLCPTLPKTTHRLHTIRDLAWILTPRTFFLTNANKFTYAAIYQALHGSSCASNATALKNMKVKASYAFGDLTLSSRSRYLHLQCSPLSRGVHGVWSLLLANLKRAPHSALNWHGVEANIRSLAEKNPHLEDVVPDFGRIRCSPHPLCRPSSGKDHSPFCSAGTDPSALGESRWVLGWTDHVSNATGDGSAFTLVGCVNNDKKNHANLAKNSQDDGSNAAAAASTTGPGHPSWATLSTVPQQSRDSIEEVWDMVKNNGFKPELFARQNYLEPAPFLY